MISGWALRIRKINCQSGGLLLWSGSVVCSPTFFFLSTAAYDNSKISIFFFFFFDQKQLFHSCREGSSPLQRELHADRGGEWRSSGLTLTLIRGYSKGPWTPHSTDSPQQGYMELWQRDLMLPERVQFNADKKMAAASFLK